LLAPPNRHGWSADAELRGHVAEPGVGAAGAAHGRERDAAARADAEAERQRIIQKLLKGGSKPKKSRGSWGGRDGGERLADRDLARFRDELEDLWRSGADPTLSRPGVCGCFDVLYEMAATRAGSR